jgi:glycosyltransferase involved in cell wall biosynthesis
VESIAADPARAREMASEGRRRVASRFDLERTLAMLDRELERAIAAR